MFHACVQRFDGMDEKILGRELNRANPASECYCAGCQGFSVTEFKSKKQRVPADSGPAEALFTFKMFLIFDIIVFSFLFDKYCSIIK